MYETARRKTGRFTLKHEEHGHEKATTLFATFHSEDRTLRDGFDAGLKKLQDSGEFDAIAGPRAMWHHRRE